MRRHNIHTSWIALLLLFTIVNRPTCIWTHQKKETIGLNYVGNKGKKLYFLSKGRERQNSDLIGLDILCDGCQPLTLLALFFEQGERE